MNKNNYTNEYYFKKAQKFDNKADPYIDSALLSAYGEMLSYGTKSEFPLFFSFSLLLSLAQLAYYLFKKDECLKKMENEEGLTEPIKLRRVIEYKRK